MDILHGIYDVVATAIIVMLIFAIVRLHRLAYRDQLTGLWNSRYFFLKGRKILNKFSEKECERVVFFIDLDGLKALNDNVSHTAGDAAIKKLADTLRDLLGKIALVARRSGDEFLVLYIAESRQKIETAAISLQMALRSMTATLPDGRNINFSATAGIKLFSEKDSLDQAVEKADKMMLKTKRRRKTDQ